MQRSAFFFAFAFGIALFGCSSDTSLRVAPAPGPDQDIDSPGAPDDDWNQGGDSDSPWANLDPGDMPDDLFAVAWLDLTTDCWNCTYAPNTPNRYDLVDALGRVVSTFALPFEWEESSYFRPELAGIHGSGPGRFLVSNYVFVGSSLEQVVWEADGFADTATVLARVRSGEVELPLAGVTVPLPTDSWVQDEVVLPDPTDPGRILIVPTSSSPYLPSDFRQIWSLSTTDPHALVRTWSLQEILPPELLPKVWDSIEAPWFADLAADGSGQLVLGIGNTLVSVDLDAPDQRWILPTDGLDLSNAPLVAPPAPDQPATVLWAAGYCGEGVRLWTEGVVFELDLPEEYRCPVVGPLLDAASRSFVYTAWIDEPEWPGAQRLVIRHRGEEVWSLDRLRVGLADRPFALLGAALVVRD